MSLTTVQPGMVQQLASSNMPTGSVLQVVTYANTTLYSTTSSTLTSTGFSASITPKFSTSKILVFFNARGTTSASGNNMNFAVYRNSTNITSTTGYASYSGAGNLATMIPLQCWDSPSTTSSTSYTIYIASSNNSSSVSINGETTQDFPSTLILMEVAA